MARFSGNLAAALAIISIAFVGCVYTGRPKKEPDKHPEMKEWPAYDATGGAHATLLYSGPPSKASICYDAGRTLLFVYGFDDKQTGADDKARVLHVFKQGELSSRLSTRDTFGSFFGSGCVDAGGNACFGNTIFFGPDYKQHQVLPTQFLRDEYVVEGVPGSDTDAAGYFRSPEITQENQRIIASLYTLKGFEDTLDMQPYTFQSWLCNDGSDDAFVLKYDISAVADSGFVRKAKQIYSPLALSPVRGVAPQPLFDTVQLQPTGQAAVDDRWYEDIHGNHYVAGGTFGFEPVFMKYYKIPVGSGMLTFKNHEGRRRLSGIIREKGGFYLMVIARDKEEVYYISQ